MRRVALACVLAACGNDAGLLLDLHPGDPNVARVEVLLPDDQPGKYMGLPPMATGVKVAGPVYEVVDTTGGTVDGNGALRVLLTPGEVSDVPAILVLGYDANDTPIRYAVVTDPSGAIHLPHTTSAHLVVDLDPITTVPVTGAASSPVSPRLVRWDGAKLDDASAKCFGILSGTGADRTAIFFGPDGDLDCDHAQPECDDTWYLRVRNPGACATIEPPADDASTMDACRIGASAGCRDGAPNAMTCAAQVPAVCVPAQVCDQCGDGLDPSCTAQQMTDVHTSHIDCNIFVRTEATASTICTMATDVIAMDTLFGSGYACDGSAGFADPMMPANMLTPDLALDGAPNTKLAFSCQRDSTDFAFAVSAAQSTPVDTSLETHGVLLLGVYQPSSATGTRTLALPVFVHYTDVGTQACPPAPMQCDLIPDGNTQADDPIWHCAGR